MMRWSFPVACLVTLAAVAGAPQPAARAAAPVADAPRSGVLLGHFDRKVRPQDDFYRHVNGKWLAETEIPADRSNYGSFTRLQDDVEKNLKAIVEEAAAAGPAGNPEQRMVGDFYASFMDESRAERLGLEPLAPEFARIAAIEDRAGLLDYLAHAGLVGIGNPIEVGILPDAKRPDVNTVWSGQSGLAMPDRDYYLKDDARFAEIRSKYQAYVADVLAMAGRKDAAEAAKRVMEFETRLAQASWPRVDLRDPTKIYNPFDLAGAAKATAGLDWTRYLAGLGIKGHDQLVVGQPSYFAEVGKALVDVPLETWKDYLQVRAIDAHAPYLNDALVQKHFDFYGRTLSGTPELKPRWKRGLAETESAVGDLLGKAYVARHFPPQAKQRMDGLVANLLEAFGTSIDELEWMSPVTRAEARRKLARFTVKIGYPDRWRDYGWSRDPCGDLVGNVRRAREFEFQRQLGKLGSRSTATNGS
jgi:putative endopeptidase